MEADRCPVAGLLRGLARRGWLAVELYPPDLQPVSTRRLGAKRRQRRVIHQVYYPARLLPVQLRHLHLPEANPTRPHLGLEVGAQLDVWPIHRGLQRVLPLVCPRHDRLEAGAG